MHGDQYDVVTSNAKWLSKFGGMLYDALIFINRPLSKYLKNLTKKIVSGASGFQNLVKNECEKGGYEGLICGHNHRPEILKFKTHVYMNTGDWVESCSAIVEEMDGTFKLIKVDENFVEYNRKIMKKILIITDAWEPQVNGVVTTMTTVVQKLKEKKFDVDVIHPGMFHTFPLPNYPEISVAWNFWDLKKKIEKSKPDYMHISVEGPLGITGRHYCLEHKIPYTIVHTHKVS